MPVLSLFSFSDYKAFIRTWIEQLPKQGRGEFARISRVTGIHKTTLSQIIKGSKDLSLEQAIKVTRHLGLNRIETEYFILLVDRARAGSEELRRHFEGLIEERRQAHSQLVNRSHPHADAQCRGTSNLLFKLDLLCGSKPRCD